MKIVSINPFFNKERIDNLELVTEKNLTVEGVVKKTFTTLSIFLLSFVLSQLLLGIFSFFDKFNVSLLILLFAIILIALILYIITFIFSSLSHRLVPTFSFFYGLSIGTLNFAFLKVSPELVFYALSLTIVTISLQFAFYKKSKVKIKDRGKKVIISSLFGILLIYFFASIANFNDYPVRLVHEISPIGLPLLIVTIILCNIILNFEFKIVEYFADEGFYSDRLEWYFAFGFLTSFVWIYFTFIRIILVIVGKSRK